MKFAFHTLGCKVNLFETQALMQLARERGHEIVSQDADAVIVNTCTVTGVSDHKNARAFHKLRREHPHAIIAACGCFAETEPDKVRASGEIDLVCGTRGRAAVIAQCEAAVLGTIPPAVPQNDGFEPLPAGVPQGRTRALLKIEDGCDNYCAYCIIPYARGHVRSMPMDDVLREAQRLKQAGGHEIVLTGIEIASYGRDLTPRADLTALLQQLLPSCPDVRFRLGSLDPRVVDASFCQTLSAFDNLAPHFHLSLQSGCDSVLHRMGRRYTTAAFAQSVSLLRAHFADCSITTDLIVGFPGETEGEFAETLAFLRRCAFAQVHVFPYSVRQGTRAAAMDGQVSEQVKTARTKKVREIAQTLSATYRAQLVGKVCDALPEHRTADGLWTSHGPFYCPIYIKGTGIAQNGPRVVHLTALHRDGLLAEMIAAEP